MINRRVRENDTIIIDDGYFEISLEEYKAQVP
jgi:hypothetical protein